MDFGYEVPLFRNMTENMRFRYSIKKSLSIAGCAVAKHLTDGTVREIVLLLLT